MGPRTIHIATCPVPTGLRALEVVALNGNRLRGVPPPLNWSRYDVDCQMGGNNFTCPTCARARAEWRVAEKRCGASCHAMTAAEVVEA